MTKTILGIIGGSGVYELDGLTDTRWEKVHSPWGEPSDALLFGRLHGVDLVFLPRHGRGHRHTPGEINYRANIDVLKRVGVTDVLSVSACGSLRQELSPGTFVLPDQFIDRTLRRNTSFFGSGLVAHVSLAHPVCTKLQSALAAAARETETKHVVGGTYLAMEGPHFSTVAESNLHRSWGCSIVGMTALPEAKLAREAELPYAMLAMVTDYDCWHAEHDHVTVQQVLDTLSANVGRARALLSNVVPKLGPVRAASAPSIERALDNALMTDPRHRDPELLAKLDAVAGRVLQKA